MRAPLFFKNFTLSALEMVAAAKARKICVVSSPVEVVVFVILSLGSFEIFEFFIMYFFGVIEGCLAILKSNTVP